MYCTNCHTALQPGATVCPVCGTPVSNDPVQSGSPSYDSTVVVSSTGTPQDAQTDYGEHQQQVSGTSHESHSSVSSAQNPYGDNPIPPPNYSYPQGQPQEGNAPVAVPSAPDAHGVVPAQPAKPRRRVGLIIGIVAGCVLLLCVGLVAFIVVSSRSGVANGTSTPSGKTVISSASAILHNPKTSTEIDQDYNPTHVTNTFKTHQLVYLTFDIDSGDKDGYIQAKWYANGQLVNVSAFSHAHANNAGLFTLAFTIPTTTGAVELYWCTKADCSDAQLAQVLHFTITNTSFAPTGPTTARIQAYRRVL